MSDASFNPGDLWRMRSGEIARIGRVMDSQRVSAYWPGRMSVFTPTGNYWFHDEESEFDLIEPVEEGAK